MKRFTGCCSTRMPALLVHILPNSQYAGNNNKRAFIIIILPEREKKIKMKIKIIVHDFLNSGTCGEFVMYCCVCYVQYIPSHFK